MEVLKEKEVQEEEEKEGEEENEEEENIERKYIVKEKSQTMFMGLLIQTRTTLRWS